MEFIKSSLACTYHLNANNLVSFCFFSVNYLYISAVMKQFEVKLLVRVTPARQSKWLVPRTAAHSVNQPKNHNVVQICYEFAFDF